MNINIKKIMRNSLFTFAVAVAGSQSVASGISWKPYSNDLVAQAEKSGKTVILAFHKKGCGTCAAQDTVLESVGVHKNEKIENIRVERRDKALDSVYEKYGYNKNQWSAMVMLKGGKEIARLEPGTTDEAKIKVFLAKAN